MLPNISDFSYQCEEQIIINCSVHKVYQALFNIYEWPKLLPHVKAIKAIYDDGQYQEFLMDVLSENNELLKVRSVRNCKNGNTILFFQPEPPAFLKHHTGGWYLNEVSPGVTHITTQHRWNLNIDVAKNKFPPTDRFGTEQQIIALLKNHANLALTTWRNILEDNKHVHH